MQTPPPDRTPRKPKPKPKPGIIVPAAGGTGLPPEDLKKGLNAQQRHCPTCQGLGFVISAKPVYSQANDEFLALLQAEDPEGDWESLMTPPGAETSATDELDDELEQDLLADEVFEDDDLEEDLQAEEWELFSLGYTTRKAPLDAGTKTVNGVQLRAIYTARTLAAIHRGIAAGFRALLEPVVPHPNIRSWYQLLQHRVCGRIVVVTRRRDPRALSFEYTEVLPATAYYPYTFPAPYAAYLLPPDLEPGERVYLYDIIADIVEYLPGQRSGRRMRGVAVWDGERMEVEPVGWDEHLL